MHHLYLTGESRVYVFKYNLGKRFWIESMNTPIYLKAQSPTAAVYATIPEWAWRGEKIYIFHLLIFSSIGQVLIPKEKHCKLNKRFKLQIF